MTFSDMVVGENGLLVQLRCHNSFNEKIYTDITNYLNKHLSEWKSTGFLPIADAVPLFNMYRSFMRLITNPIVLMQIIGNRQLIGKKLTEREIIGRIRKVCLND